MSEIDEATGLPALPEGQFWRVKPERYTGKAWLYLMQRGEIVRPARTERRWWWRTVEHPEVRTPAEWEVDGHPIVEANPGGVLWAARRLIDKQGIFGDYPPKRLEVDE